MEHSVVGSHCCSWYY